MTDIYNKRPERGPMYHSRWGMTKPRPEGSAGGRRRGGRGWAYTVLVLTFCAIALVLLTCYFVGGL